MGISRRGDKVLPMPQVVPFGRRFVVFVAQLCFHSFHVVLSLLSHLHMCEHITCGFLLVQAFRSVGKTMTHSSSGCHTGAGNNSSETI